ncbi:MAG: hypothetical protein HF978_03610 [Desulfobacteraceae bacterium]|nr:hypothetical protein [Desulfobacteraceae bacterium]MBC2754613.1 hypothetical protein [Desulfobacteraceae bacterium]
MRNIKSVVIVTFTALSLFIMTPAVFAGNSKGHSQGPGDGTGPVHSIIDGVPVEITGIVTSIGTRGNGISVDTGVEIVTVYGLGPLFFWDAAGIAKPEIGEEIVVNGYEIAISDGSYRIIAGSVIIGGEELILRDPESGAPLWRGGAGGNGFGDGTGDGTGECIYSVIDDAGLLLSANQTRTRDRKKDDSCQNPLIDSMADSLVLAKGGHGKGGGGKGGGGHGPGDGKGNDGNGPKNGSGNGSKSGTCTNA